MPAKKQEEKEVLMIYCKCGKNLICIGDPNAFSSKELASAIKEKRKVKIIPFKKYQKMDIKPYCPNFVSEEQCPNNIKSKS
jgi:hypothetical protein